MQIFRTSSAAGHIAFEQDRADRSIRDHLNIIKALEARDTERAGDLVRDHALGLAEHVRRTADYLD